MISILTDFQNSEYVGIMKGVLYSICPDANVVDLCNTIRPQNIREASWVLYSSYRFFPSSTIFLCVVDPGVGGKRKPIFVKTRNYTFVAPDNGLVFPAAKDDGIENIYEIKEEKCRTIIKTLNPRVHFSTTFHGRDIFSVCAAFLETGGKLESIGTKISEMKKLEFYLKGRTGEVVRIDAFGNIITNLPPTGKGKYNVNFRDFNKILKFYKTYSEAPDNELILVEGSSGTLEISVKNSSAQKLLNLVPGRRIKIE